jgi:hypothetical protein
MRVRIASGVLLMALSLYPAIASGQASRQPYRGRETWYEFLVRKANPANLNYGAWLEERRQAFLAASVKTPYFWFGLGAAGGLVFMLLVDAKRVWDDRRKMQITAEMMADLYNHDQHSRQIAREAIDRHNQHIEQCNRAFEAAESGDGRPGWGGAELETLRTELKRVADELDVTKQDRNRLREELRQKALVVTDLSFRLDSLAKKMNGQGDARPGTAAVSFGVTGGDGAQLVDHINRLQEELYAERQKNRRLKGN